MSVFHRLGHLIQEDLAALRPGSGVGLNRETGLRLVPYLALLFFVIGLLFPGIFSAGSGVIRAPAIQPPVQRQAPPATGESNESEAAPERDDVRDSESI